MACLLQLAGEPQPRVAVCLKCLALLQDVYWTGGRCMWQGMKEQSIIWCEIRKLGDDKLFGRRGKTVFFLFGSSRVSLSYSGQVVVPALSQQIPWNLVFLCKIYLFLFMLVHCHCLQTQKDIRFHYRWLWANMWVLGIELRTFGRAVSAHSGWAISPAQVLRLCSCRFFQTLKVKA